MTNPEALTILEKSLRDVQRHVENGRKSGEEPDARTLATAMIQTGELVLHTLDSSASQQREAVRQ